MARMTHYDVFNGDADGICALQQLRLARPRTSTLVTGVKRDNALLARVNAGVGDTVTVLDVSYRRNGDDVERLLAAGARIRYIDHHDPGAVADHPRLETHIDTAPRMSTGLIVDRLLGGAHRDWAIVSAFGDNHLRLAARLCADAGLAPDEAEALRRLGIALNYNSYGLRVADLHVAPDALYRQMAPFADPLEFARQPLPRELWKNYRTDIARAEGTQPLLEA
ncbi:MAG TPA: acetyltransferase, partial [Candidatus Poseidoniales archaeon]|nr:acetyltransferase [Candidatus Poseidoniales archaeon]